MMYWTGKNRIAIAFLILFAVLIANGLASVESIVRSNRIRESVTHTHHVLRTLEATLRAMIDIDDAERDFAVTGLKSVLGPYESALIEIRDKVQEVRRLTADNPRQQRRLDALEPLIAEKLDLARETISERRVGESQLASSALTDRVKQLMETIRSQIEMMANEEHHLLERREQQSQAATWKTFGTLLVATLLGLGLLGAAYFIVLRHLNERTLAEETLRDSQHQFHSFMDNSPALGYMKDQEGRLVYVNQAVTRYFPVTPKDWVGKMDKDLWPAEIAERIRRNDQAVLASGQATEEVETVPGANGGLRHWLCYKFPIRNAAGHQFLGGMAVEITERVKAEEDLKSFAARLEQSNRELQDFAYVASHDLQEPLRKIQAFGDRLKDKCGAEIGDQGRDYIERMQGAAARMQTLINDLLTFSRVTTKAQPFVPLDLGQAAREVLSDLETRIEQTGGRVELGALPSIEADPLQIRQLLQNLVGNALKFHRPDKTPVIKISGHIRNGREASADEADGVTEPQPPTCEISVADNGIGFDEKYLDRIFDVFQRLHGRHQYEGTGVGLAICRKIAERHHGTITARSEPNRGAQFIVTLPVKQPSKGNCHA